MRVYEYAKKVNLTNKELLDLLLLHEFEVASHMSALTDEALAFLDEKFGPEEEEEVPVKIKEEKKPAKVGKVSAVNSKFTKSKAPVPAAEEAAPVVVEKKVIKPKVSSVIVKPTALGSVAEQLGIPASELILYLLRKGKPYAINQILGEDVIVDIANHFQLEAIFPEKQQANILQVGTKNLGTFERLPVVVVLGHVDHGKTTLLDTIRKTRVVAKEKGGITQHLGAYKAHTKQGDLVFLDTPGHAAFSKMRARGARAADIAILVVAADDSIKPQTVEAIKHIKELELPVIVAVNKMDKADPARLDIVRRDLAQYDLLPEEWGGQTVSVPISALTGKGIDELLEMIALQAQLLELRADPSRPASGFILESKIERGRGPIATLICQQGTLRVGDFFSAGHTQGKVNSIIDEAGKSYKEIGPSVPVLIAGFDDLANAGDYFEVVTKEEYKALKSSKGIERVTKMTFSPSSEDALNLIIKTDTQSTKEALLGSIDKLSTQFTRPVHIVYAGVGDMMESDITLAADTGSRVIGLHVKIEPNAHRLAQQNLVDVKLFDIIYKLLEHLEVIAQKEHKAEKVVKKIGQATVLKVFPIKNLGVIAGAVVNQGRFSKDGKVKIYRGKEFIAEGGIKSLQRDRKTVKEVHEGFECAFLIDGFDAWEQDDRVECYLEMMQ